MLTYGTVACYYKTVERATKSKLEQTRLSQTPRGHYLLIGHTMEELKAIKIIGNQNDGRVVFLCLPNTG